ncbi:MAG: site-specific integrase, partial [Mesotoga sp.]
MNFNESVERFKENMEFVRNMSSNTIGAYLSDLRHFECFLTDHDIDYTTVKRRDIELFVKEYSQGKYSKKRPSATTVARNLSTIRSFYTFLYISG